jgi:hypothetical protein
MLDLAEIFADFNFTSYREVGQALEMTLGAMQYRVELVHQDSNKTNPWGVKVYSMQSGDWKPVTDFPWVQERNEGSALRLTLSFIQEGKAN